MDIIISALPVLLGMGSIILLYSEKSLGWFLVSAVLAFLIQFGGLLPV